MEIAGKTYKVFAHSYLGGGGAEALETYLNKLVKVHLLGKKQLRIANGKIIYSPCHNYGFVKDVTVHNTTYEVRGAFVTPKACEKLLKKFFFCNVCEYKNQPRLVGDFYCFSVFTYAFRGTGIVTKDDQKVTMDMIESGTRRFCSKRENELDFKADEYADLRCFQMNYIKALLKFGYRVQKSKNFKLFSANSLGGFDLNWAVGAVLISNDLI